MWREPLLRRGATVAPPAQKRCAVDPSSSSSLSQAPEGNGCFCHILSYILNVAKMFLFFFHESSSYL